jgi:hypothetical protein
MNDPAIAILAGLSGVRQHWPLVLGILVLLLTSQILLASLLYWIFKDRFTGEEYLSLSLAGWLLPASVISLLWYLGAAIFSPLFSNIFMGILILAGILLSIRNKWVVTPSRGVFWSLVLLAALFILLRLAFVSRAIVPSYFDSPQHYLYIKDILAQLGPPGSETTLLPGYYHRGFHFLAAFLVSIMRLEITDTMLVLGQFILALIPFSAFFIVRHWTHSNAAGFLALILAALGWYMPTHAVDWGKYPALASIALIPFVLSIAYLCIEYRNILSRGKYLSLVALLMAGAVLSVFLHSRSLVIFILVIVAWLIARAWNIKKEWPRFLLFSFFLLAVAGQVVYIQLRGILGPLFDAYGPRGILSSVSVLVLSVFAYRAYPRLVFFCIVCISFLLASLFVVLGSMIPGYVNTTLLDRPYVQMILYLPLTLLAGFGMAGLEHVLKDRVLPLGKHHVVVSNIIAGLLMVLAAAHGLLQYDLYPSECCLIMGQDDLVAIQWLDENLPKGARILTASTDLNVLPTERYQGSAGGDAGTWITPLTGRPVALLPFHTDFSQSQTLEMLCGQQLTIIYVGKTGYSFNDAVMNAQPDAYTLLLDLPKAKIYEVTGCK